MARSSSRKRRLLIAAAISVAALVAATFAFGPLGFAIAFVTGLLATAWYGDDNLGSCLPLAVMFVLALLVIGVLIAMLMFVHRQ